MEYGHCAIIGTIKNMETNRPTVSGHFPEGRGAVPAEVSGVSEKDARLACQIARPEKMTLAASEAAVVSTSYAAIVAIATTPVLTWSW